jgi:hypothetical protein
MTKQLTRATKMRFKSSSKIFLCIILFILFPLAVQAEYPDYIIRFSGPENESAYNSYGTYWLSNHEIVIEGWYYNLNTRQIIPPYLNAFPLLSPYDGRTLVYLIEPYLYLSTIDLYSQGVPPLKIAELPPGTIFGMDSNFSFHMSWISDGEILIILFKNFPFGNFDDKRQNKIFIYSLSNSEFTEIGEDGLPDIIYFEYVFNTRSYTGNRIVINGREPEIPFGTSLLYQYTPETKKFTLRARLNELGFVDSGITPEFVYRNGKWVELIYDINIMDNGRVCYSLIDNDECIAFDSENRSVIKRVRLPFLSDGRYDTSFFSPDNSFLVVVIRPISPIYRNLVLEYLVFSETFQDSYLHSIYTKKPFGVINKKYEVPHGVDVVVSELFEGLPKDLKTSGTQQFLKDWIVLLNNKKLTNGETHLTAWDIPQTGSLLYILGRRDLTIIEIEANLNR